MADNGPRRPDRRSERRHHAQRNCRASHSAAQRRPRRVRDHGYRVRQLSGGPRHGSPRPWRRRSSAAAARSSATCRRLRLQRPGLRRRLRGGHRPFVSRRPGAAARLAADDQVVDTPGGPIGRQAVLLTAPGEIATGLDFGTSSSTIAPLHPGERSGRAGGRRAADHPWLGQRDPPGRSTRRDSRSGSRSPATRIPACLPPAPRWTRRPATSASPRPTTPTVRPTISVVLRDNGGTADGGSTTPARSSRSRSPSRRSTTRPALPRAATRRCLEDAGPQTVAGWASGIIAGPADEAGQSLTFEIIGNTNPDLFAAGPTLDAATGDLSYTPADNAHGSAMITVVLRDDGGTRRRGRHQQRAHVHDHRHAAERPAGPGGHRRPVRQGTRARSRSRSRPAMRTCRPTR